VPFKVFLSHSTVDEELSQKVKAAIEATGTARVYLAELDIQVGAVLADKLMAEVRRSDAVVLLFTKHAARSAFVHQEIGFALRDKPVLPLVERGVPAANLGMLAGREYLPFDPTDPTDAIERLGSFVAGLARAKDRRELQMLMGAIGVLLILAYMDAQQT
jgi:hypothetical protein